jgi:hypothetical protein
MNISLLIGITGTLLILWAFVMNQWHKWSEDDLGYDLCNALGSLLMIFYALSLHSLPFFILNFVWFALSLRDVWYDLRPNVLAQKIKLFSKWLQRKK